MKLIKNILFAFALMAAVSVAAFAQKDEKKPPPKERPPVVNPAPSKPPPEPKPKKPGEEVAFWKSDISETA